jgi:hypothetical protein
MNDAQGRSLYKCRHCSYGWAIAGRNCVICESGPEPYAHRHFWGLPQLRTNADKNRALAAIGAPSIEEQRKARAEKMMEEVG